MRTGEFRRGAAKRDVVEAGLEASFGQPQKIKVQPIANISNDREMTETTALGASLMEAPTYS